MGKRWNYSGDINLEYGGLFWREDGADDYVLAVRVTPCSDAGGPGNLYHVEQGSIYMPADAARRKAALDCCGYNDPPREGAKPLTHFQKRWQLVDAFCAYQGLERDTFNGETVIQIGKAETGNSRGDGWSPKPDVILRAGSSLRNYIKNHFLN